MNDAPNLMAALNAVAPASLAESRERRMRRSIETERGAAYTAPEWGEAKSNLVAFFGLLAELDLKYSEGRR